MEIRPVMTRRFFNALSQPDLDLNEKVELMRGYVKDLYSDSLQHGRIENLFGVLTDLHPLEPQIRDLFFVVSGSHGRL